MKTLFSIVFLTAGLAFVLLGCSDNSSPVESSTDQGLSTAATPTALAKGGVVASASGSAQMYLDAEGYPTQERSDILRLCTFSARQYADGSYSGQIMSQGVPGKPWVFKGEVVQLRVQGNKAKTIYKLTKAMEGYEDWFAVWAVIDNGEGSTAPLDENTIFFGPWPSVGPNLWNSSPDQFIDFLTNTIKIPPEPIRIGNIQVRGESIPE